MRLPRLARLPGLLLAVLLLVPVLVPVFAKAQSTVTGAVSGTLTDPAGAVVADSAVTLTDVDTGDARTTTTNHSGLFLFSWIKPGAYVLTLERSGFRDVSQSTNVFLGQTTTADIKLQLSSTSQELQVTSQAESLQREDGNTAFDIGIRTIENMPNPGGDLSYIPQLAPGVTMNTSSSAGLGSFSAFGLPGTSNLFTINGSDYNDPFANINNAGSSNLLLGTNELQEVAVVTNGYTGEYGRQAGAQVNYSTKSGTNSFHGDAVYKWNGSSMNANDFFLNSDGTPKPFENNNQWAASLGGPIKKNKLFFFVNTEGIRYVFGTANDVFVPDPALETYVLNNLNATDATAVPFYQKMFALYNAAPGISRAVPVANTADNPTCGSLAAFAPPSSGNGPSCLDSFFSSSSNGNREWFVSGRVDYNPTEKDTLFLRLKFDRGLQPTYTDPINSVFNAQSKQPQNEAQFNYTHVFNSRIANSFVGSVLYTSSVFESPNQAAALSAFPYVYISDDTSLTSLGEGASTEPYFSPYPSGRRVTQWQLVDDVSVERGNHTFKVGVNFRRDDISDWTASTGSFPVEDSFLADFANDQVDGIGQDFALHPVQPLAFYSLGFYLQDEFRVSPTLRVTLALRADRNSGGSCQSDCVARAAEPFEQLNHDPAIPYNQMMVTNISQILPGTDSIVFEPRVGFAWSPLGRNTVIRGGVGLFSDLYPGSILDYFTRNFPQVTSFTNYSGAGAMSPDDVGNAAALIASCNSIFQSNYNAGGTVADFENAAPSNCATPNLKDVVNPFKTPKYVKWNLEVQHSIGPNTIVSVDYVGNHGYDELLLNPYLNAWGVGGLPSAAPDTRVQNVLEFTNAGISNYNGVTLSLRQRFWHGLQGALNYTYSHSLDDVSNGDLEQYSLTDSLQFQMNPFNPRANYANSDYDLRHYLSANYVWDLPLKSHVESLNRIVGGWTLSGTVFYHTGFPYSIVDGITEATYSDQNLEHSIFLAQPITSIPKTCTSIDPNNPCYTSSNFAAMPASQFSSGGRNGYRGPGFFNTDLSLRKNFQATERLGVTLGFDAYNVLNHPNFANPNANLADGASLGYITSTVESPTSPYGSGAMAATDARIIELVAKLIF